MTDDGCPDEEPEDESLLDGAGVGSEAGVDTGSVGSAGDGSTGSGSTGSGSTGSGSTGSGSTPSMD